MAVGGGEAILNYLWIVIVQNLDNIPERTDQQHLIQVGCPAAAMMSVSMATFPNRIVIGGGMPIQPPISAATIGTVDLVSE